MEKANLTNLGVSEKVANFVLVTKSNRAINPEGLEVGDTIVITGVEDDLAKFNENEYVNLSCTGSRDSISLGKLVGTGKVEKYFGKEVAERAIKFPRRMGEALEFILTNLKGKTIECIAIEEGCGQYEQTFAVFALAE